MPSRPSDLISIEEKISFWNAALTIDLKPLSEEILLEDEDDLWDPESNRLEKFSKQYGFLKERKEYQWLLERIRAATNLSTHNSRTISTSLKATVQKGDQGPASIYSAAFQVELNLRAFLDQYYQDDPCQNIGNVFVLTGCAVNAQIVSCEQYVKQLWPISGVEILRALENSLTYSSGDTYICEPPIRYSKSIEELNRWA